MFVSGRVCQPEIIALLDQLIIFLESCDLIPYFLFFLFRKFSGIQLITKGSGHRHHRSRLQRSGPSRLVVRAGGNMGSHSGNRITE